jgi:glycerophosphoryl diester phosphodiesterase
MGKTLNIAHRGGAALKPENTMAAFADAIARGCDGAELDVQLSADGVVVVHHDYRLNPAITRHAGGWLTGQTPAIKDLSYARYRPMTLAVPIRAAIMPAPIPSWPPPKASAFPPWKRCRTARSTDSAPRTTA